MPRRFVAALVGLSATVAFFVGLVVARPPAPALAGTSAATAPPTPVESHPQPARVPMALGTTDRDGPMSFADVAERLNPAVVNVDATTRGESRPVRRFSLPTPDHPELFDRPLGRDHDREESHRGTGTGFVIAPNGVILTNHHVVDGAERIIVRLADGRRLAAKVVGADPDTDVALLKVDPVPGLVAAPLGDSNALRVGEWVCAIGNPLAYEHTVTVGVVSFIGRKLFEGSLDRYIQTDAAINLGNSGGPLINAKGEVVGINAAISSRANNIGFAIPINQARDILPQLSQTGRVARGFAGVTLRDIDPDLDRSLRLGTTRGGLVQDVMPGSPAWRAGVRPYDVVVALDGRAVTGNDQFLAAVSARSPGSAATLDIVRDGRAIAVPLKLAERPPRAGRPLDADGAPEARARPSLSVGLFVRDMDDEFSRRFQLPDDVRGVVVSAVEPISPASDADIERNQVIVEVNRQPATSVDAFRRLTSGARSGDVLALYLYNPELRQHQLRTLRVGDR